MNLPNFHPGQMLKASDLQTLSDAIAELQSQTRENRLELSDDFDVERTPSGTVISLQRVSARGVSDVGVGSSLDFAFKVTAVNTESGKMQIAVAGGSVMIMPNSTQFTDIPLRISIDAMTEKNSTETELQEVNLNLPVRSLHARVEEQKIKIPKYKLIDSTDTEVIEVTVPVVEVQTGELKIDVNEYKLENDGTHTVNVAVKSVNANTSTLTFCSPGSSKTVVTSVSDGFTETSEGRVVNSVAVGTTTVIPAGTTSHATVVTGLSQTETTSSVAMPKQKLTATTKSQTINAVTGINVSNTESSIGITKQALETEAESLETSVKTVTGFDESEAGTTEWKTSIGLPATTIKTNLKTERGDETTLYYYSPPMFKELDGAVSTIAPAAGTWFVTLELSVNYGAVNYKYLMSKDYPAIQNIPQTMALNISLTGTESDNTGSYFRLNLSTGPTEYFSGSFPLAKIVVTETENDLGDGQTEKVYHAVVKQLQVGAIAWTPAMTLGLNNDSPLGTETQYGTPLTAHGLEDEDMRRLGFKA